LILFGLYTGQRLGDLAALTRANVDLARSELHLITRKRGKPLTIPLATPLREHILNHLSANDVPDAPVHPRAFVTLKRDKRVRHLSAQFGDLLAAAGLRDHFLYYYRFQNTNIQTTDTGPRPQNVSAL
jgi:integrase